MHNSSVIPTAEQLQQTKQAIETYIRSIDAHRDRRQGAYPYYLFHPPGEAIRGTVMLFHGFSARPHQLWRLANYLFRNGFNVYQASLAGHTLLNPAKNWPQVDLVPEIAEPLKVKVQQDPVLMNYFSNLSKSPEASAHPSRVQQAAIVARLVAIEPRLLEIVRAIEDPGSPSFTQYFVSSHLQYVEHAKARLAELDALPGPIYTVGLSVGGAVALGLAAHHPERIERVVAYAPLLRIYGKERRQYVNLMGPLDVSESGWDPNLQFPVGCLTAVDRFGYSEVLSSRCVRSLQNIPTFLVLTENEDAADINTNKDLFEKLGGSKQGHQFYLYPTEDLVPHPMVDPTEISQGMSNRFWQSLYQETFRFLTTGTVDLENMKNLEQNSDLPAVTPVEGQEQ